MVLAIRDMSTVIYKWCRFSAYTVVLEYTQMAPFVMFCCGKSYDWPIRINAKPEDTGQRTNGSIMKLNNKLIPESARSMLQIMV